jgi:hypothetical protein
MEKLSLRVATTFSVSGMEVVRSGVEAPVMFIFQEASGDQHRSETTLASTM